jgi:cytochrome b involved in lipid metabolism
MVWLSFGVLVASVSFLIYRHSTAPWETIRSCLQLRFRVVEKEDDGRMSQRKRGGVRKPKSSDSEEPRERSLQDGKVNAGSARPVKTDDNAPSVSVPTFNLESSTDPVVDTKPSVLSPSLRLSSPATGSTSLVQPLPPTQEATNVSTLMPPPPRLKPPTMSAPPGPSSTTPLRPPPSAASALRVPVTKPLLNASLAPSPQVLEFSSSKPSRKVILEPGHSPLDWANLKSNPNSNLRGTNLPAHYICVPPSQLRTQNGRKGRDAWTVWQGRVYNITPYLPFHPGGKGELMRAAGKDEGKLFMEVHPWVNWEGLLNECLVGILVAEGEEKGGRNELEEMD